MAPKNPVRTLREITEDSVLVRICAIILEEIYSTVSDEFEAMNYLIVTDRLQLVRDILACSIGPNAMESILSRILQKDQDIEPNVRYIALQMLLVRGIRTLVIGHFPEHYYSVILEAIAESAADLKRLDLRGIWVRTEDKFYLHKLLRRINGIQHLVLRYVCDDDTLEVIGKYCGSLQRLDICGAPNITVRGIQSLTSHPSRSSDSSNISKTLIIVDIGGPGAMNLSLDVARELLLKLPNLKSLGSYDKVGLVLTECIEKNPGKCFELQYLHDVHTKSSSILSITKTCPQLRAIYLDTPGSVAVQHVHLFRELRELKLHKVKSSDLMNVLDSCGDRLRSMSLLSVYGQTDLVKLGEKCPDLVRLELHNVSLTCTITSHPRALQKIEQMFIYSTQVTTTCIKMILNQTVNVQHLALGECKELNDAAVLCSLMDHSLLKVHTLWFGLAENLTMRTVDGLIEKCPNLTSLGNLASWKVSNSDVISLRERLVSSNTNLSIHHIGPEEEEVDFIQIYEE